jgi:hypothetical protein
VEWRGEGKPGKMECEGSPLGKNISYDLLPVGAEWGKKALLMDARIRRIVITY